MTAELFVLALALLTAGFPLAVGGGAALARTYRGHMARRHRHRASAGRRALSAYPDVALVLHMRDRSARMEPKHRF